MSVLSLANLYQLGTHRGNSKSKLNPRLKDRVYSYQNNICTIDLVSTIDSINRVKDLFSKLGSRKKQILVVGTSAHIADTVMNYSSKIGSVQNPYVNVRWLGGCLTNWSTVRKSLKVLEKLENMQSNDKFFSTLARNEQLRIQREIEKKAKVFTGLKSMKTNKPGAVLILDTAKNPIAIKEAETMNIPVVAICNTFTTTLPKNLEYTILCNNNSVSSVQFILDELVESYNKGLAQAAEAVSQSKEKQTPAIVK